MIFKWQSQEDKLLKFMKIPPKKKLEWLYQMHVFLCNAFTKKQKDIFWKLRQNKSN